MVNLRRIACTTGALLLALSLPAIAFGAGSGSDSGDDVTDSSPATTTQPASKTVTPTSTKEISHDGKVWTDAISSSVHETIYYRVTGTMPGYKEPYDDYPYAFIDTNDGNIIVDAGSVTVSWIHDGEATDVTDKFGVVQSEDGKKLTVGLDDLKTAFPDIDPSDTFVLMYEAKFAQTPAIGFAHPNENKCYIAYSGEREGDRPPDTYGPGTPQETTPTITWAYSYSIDILKVAKDTRTPLAGAKFAIKNLDGKWLTDDSWDEDEAKHKIFETDSNGHTIIKGIGLGSYSLVEVEAPAGYEKIGDTDITVATAQGGEKSKTLVAKASGEAVLKSVDSGEGVLSLELGDPKTEDPNKKDPTDDDKKKDTGDKSGDDQNKKNDDSGIASDLQKRASNVASKLSQLGAGIQLALIAGVVAIAGALFVFFAKRRNDG